MSRDYANRYMKVYDEFGDVNHDTYRHLGVQALYQIATMSEEQRTQPHNVPSTGEVKAVDEMTVRELREVKKALKEAEAKASRAESDAEVARRDAEIKARQLARATEPIIKEIEVERIVEVDKTDYHAKQRLF